MGHPMDKVTRDIADIRRQLAGASQLNHSSLENSAIPVHDADGNERLRIGVQDDGTHAVKYVQGPPPPRPTAPVVSVDGPVVRVRWDGMLMGGHIPEDFSRIDVHFALTSEDLEDESAVRGNLATSAGNETVLAATQTGTYRVGLVAMSQSRARSEMSEVVDVDVTLVDIEGALDAVVENARGGSNYYSPEPPSGTDHDPDRDLWFDTSVDAEGLVSYSPHRWDADLQEWVSVADQRTAALQDALGDFEGTVEQRFTDAGDRIDGLETSLTELDSTTLPGLRQDLDAAEGRLGEAEGQITDAFGQLDAVPGQIDAARQAAEQAAQGYTDAQLSSEAADLAAAIAAAQATADEAMNTADGAIRTYYEPVAPTLDTHPGLTLGDMWYDTVNEDAYRWNGSQWNVIQDSNVAVALAKAEEALAVADGKITTYRQDNKPSAGELGDLWFDTDDNNAPYYCTSEDPVQWVLVRDEEIAAAELRAAQDALEKAEAARDAAITDAEGKIGVARQEAIDAAIEEMGGIPRPSYGSESPTHDAPDGSVYFQTDPTALAEHAWAGEPHASESIKYVDGEEVARNHVNNPSYEGPLAGLDIWFGTFAVTSGFPGAFSASGGISGSNILHAKSLGTNYIITFFTATDGYAPVPAGNTHGAIRAQVAHDTPPNIAMEVRIGVIYRTPTGLVYMQSEYVSAPAWGGRAITFPHTIPSGATEVGYRIQWRSRDSAQTVPEGTRLFAEKIHVATADTEAAALAQVEEYFDGDSPNGVINWKNKVTAQWERRDGEWTQVPIRSEAIANLDVGKLTAGAGEIAELVSRKIAAATGQFLELDVGQLTVTEQSKLADVVAEQIAADTARFMELEVGKLVASEGILDEAVIRQLFAEVVVSQMSFAESFIGGNAILEGSITAESGIIGSLDLGVAIVGKLHGMYIEGQSIDTEQLAFGAATGDILSVDALNFKTALGLDIRSSSFRAGDSVEITEDFGIRQFGPDGALNVSLPSDGSQAEFRGDLSARTLTATGRMSIQGPGAIASGGVLELESGVVPPVAGPQITNVWDRTTFPPLAGDQQAAGIAWMDGHWWRALTTAVPFVDGGVAVMQKITPAGELVSEFDIAFRTTIDGVTALGGRLYVLGASIRDGVGSLQDRAVVVYNPDGTESRRWDDTLYTQGTHAQGIGNDGTNIILAKAWNDGILRLRKWTPTGTYLETATPGFAFLADVAGIYFGAADFGSNQVVVARRSAETGWLHFITLDSGTYTYRPELSWRAADLSAPVGFAWDGGRFHSLQTDGDLASYQSLASGFVGDDADDWWGAVAWATGDQVTPVGPATNFRYLRRSQLRRQNGDVPQGVEQARFYVSKAPLNDPVRTDLRWVTTSNSPAEPTRVLFFPVGWETRGHPPTSNSFTTDAPGEIHSAIGNFRVDGSGAGEWGPLTFHADGTMDGPISHGVVNIPAVAGSNTFATVTLPAGKYSSPPTVTTSAESSDLSSTRATGVRNVTETSFDLVLLRMSAATIPVHWIAMGE